MVNKNNFRVFIILCITNFCETRKIYSNTIRVLFFSEFPEKQQVRTKLDALKIIFHRRCALNN